MTRTRPASPDTPRRVAEAFEERFGGYREDAAAELARTFEDVSGYSDMILLRDVRFESHCEHHIAPFTGVAHVAYVPSRRVVGLSKLARVVDIFARRLQVQEALTAQIATTIQERLAPRGVAVMIARAPSVHDAARREPAGGDNGHHAFHRRFRSRRQLGANASCRPCKRMPATCLSRRPRPI